MRPPAAINGIIYVGGASDFQGGLVVDTTNSFSFDPASNTTGSIAAIPRATGETRALSFNGLMLVMGGGRVAPNPSNEVDIYDPGTNAWTTGSPVPAFMTARRNFPTDTNGADHIWLSGGYDITGLPTDSTEVFCQRRWNAYANADGLTVGYGNVRRERHRRRPPAQREAHLGRGRRPLQ